MLVLLSSDDHSRQSNIRLLCVPPVECTSPGVIQGDKESADFHCYQFPAAHFHCSPSHKPEQTHNNHLLYKVQISHCNQSKQKSALTSPLSTRAMEEVCPHVIPTTVLPCKQPVTFLGYGWFAVEPEPTWPQLL